MTTDLDWIAMTVWGEARGESFQGKLAVAYVICNRMTKAQTSACAVVLKPWQFSFWNTDDPSRHRMQPSFTNADWRDSYKAAAAAYFATLPDPTKGSTSYLNPKVCTADQKKRAGYTRERVVTSIGNHDFFIAI